MCDNCKQHHQDTFDPEKFNEDGTPKEKKEGEGESVSE